MCLVWAGMGKRLLAGHLQGLVMAIRVPIHLGVGVGIKGHVAAPGRAPPACRRLTLYLWKKVR